MTVRIRHCGDSRTHKPHTYYGPSERKGETKQVQYKCPGTKLWAGEPTPTLGIRPSMMPS